VWIVRLGALAVVAAVVLAFGPTAWRHVAHAASSRVAKDKSTPVALHRVGFRGAPRWLQSALLPEVMTELAPRIEGPDGDAELSLLDEAGARALIASLEASPWVVEARMERVFPDRMRLFLDVRQPVLTVEHSDLVRFSVDRRGTCLPPVASVALPVVRISGVWEEGAPAPTLGTVHPDPRVHAALEVALEWRDQLVPLVPGAPELLEVDAFNLEERQMVGARDPDIRVVLRRSDGAGVSFAWGRPPSTQKSRVPVGTKAQVLRAILDRYPGLGGLTGGDLRFQNLWERWLLPRQGPDPVGPEPAGA